MMVVQFYHQERGEENMNVCIIHVSTYGTNPTSATMCGIKIVYVGTYAKGNINIKELMRVFV